MHQDVNSNSRGSLLTKMEAESDSDVPEFSLPPKSIVKRPKKTIRKRFILFTAVQISVSKNILCLSQK